MKPIPHSRYHLAGLGVLLAVGLTGCMSSNEVAGTVVGGTAGAVIGNQFGKGDGNTAATAIGAIIGASIGQQIGAALDRNSQQRAAAATTAALESDSDIVWENPDNAGGPAHGRVAITRSGVNPQGQVCREYTNTIFVAGQEQQAYGTACRDANGDWQIVS